MNTNVELNPLSFPASDPWPNAVEGAVLLDELARLLRRFVVLPKCAAESLALWTVHTYAFPLRNVSTYIELVPKSRNLGCW